MMYPINHPCLTYLKRSGQLYRFAQTFLQYDEIEEFEWENMALAEMLPEPPSNKGSNLMNSDSYLSVDIQDVSKNEYKDYINTLTKFQVKSGAFIYRDKFYRELRKSVLWQYFLPINVYKITKKLFFLSLY